ncbi:rhomboid family intramembrane serine protease [Thermodesulfobacteriota bacterium]
MLITSQFEVTEHISKFINLIRKTIAYYEGETVKLDIREKLGKSYENIIPICSISICALLIIFYFFQLVLIENSNLVLELLRLGGLNKFLLINGEYFRITSSLFLHLNSFHLIVNLFTLMIFGNLIEHIILKVNLITLFLISGVLSSFLSIISGQYVVTIGASGGIYGIIGAYLFIRIKYRDLLPSFIQLQQGWILFVIFSINMLYPLIDSNIDFFCHLGGLVTGFAYMVIISHFQNHKIHTLGDKNIITNSLFLIITLFYMFNFLSFGNFIFVNQDYRDYQNRFIRSVLHEDIAIPSDQIINFVAYYIANQEKASTDDLHNVKSKMELIAEKRPGNHQCKDTLALIYFRLGLLDKAIELQKQAISLKKNKEYIIQLKKFEVYKANKI